MPVVKIEIIKGKNAEYKRLLLDCVHEALVSVLEIQEDDRYQRLYELDEDCFERSEDKTEKFTLIELTIFPGRSKELKCSVINQITCLLGERLNIKATDIFIIIHEPPLENWGLSGKQASELGLKYKE